MKKLGKLLQYVLTECNSTVKTNSADSKPILTASSEFIDGKVSISLLKNSSM